MRYRCDGLTYKGKYHCTEDVTWSVTATDTQGRQFTQGACGHHLNQIAQFLTRNDDVSRPATRLEVKPVR